MRETWNKFQKSPFGQFIRKHEKYLPVIFFMGGFVFDTMTLGRIDRVYDRTILSVHITSLTLVIYLFNLADDGKWKNTFLEKVQDYFPLMIQFFFGALSSAFVIYFSRSVSMSKTITFFVILLVLLFANELLKQRISNKYLQFSIYFFINFTFSTFMVPVIVKEVSTEIFIISGLISLTITLSLLIFIYWKSPSTRAEISLWKQVGLILAIYATINLFYYKNLIPPVPLALDSGMVAHSIVKENDKYIVTYERDDWYIFWRDHRIKFISKPGERVYVFTSIFAPTEINKKVAHRWKKLNEETGEWEVSDQITYEVTGGRDDGYRGYTYKDNASPGVWKVDVITEKENLILGVINFEIIVNKNLKPKRVVERRF